MSRFSFAPKLRHFRWLAVIIIALVSMLSVTLTSGGAVTLSTSTISNNKFTAGGGSGVSYDVDTAPAGTVQAGHIEDGQGVELTVHFKDGVSDQGTPIKDMNAQDFSFTPASSETLHYNNYTKIPNQDKVVFRIVSTEPGDKAIGVKYKNHPVKSAGNTVAHFIENYLNFSVNEEPILADGIASTQIKVRLSDAIDPKDLVMSGTPNNDVKFGATSKDMKSFTPGVWNKTGVNNEYVTGVASSIEGDVEISISYKGKALNIADNNVAHFTNERTYQVDPKFHRNPIMPGGYGYVRIKAYIRSGESRDHLTTKVNPSQGFSLGTYNKTASTGNGFDIYEAWIYPSDRSGFGKKTVDVYFDGIHMKLAKGFTRTIDIKDDYAQSEGMLFDVSRDLELSDGSAQVTVTARNLPQGADVNKLKISPQSNISVGKWSANSDGTYQATITSKRAGEYKIEVSYDGRVGTVYGNQYAKFVDQYYTVDSSPVPGDNKHPVRLSFHSVYDLKPKFLDPTFQLAIKTDPNDASISVGSYIGGRWVDKGVKWTNSHEVDISIYSDKTQDVKVTEVRSSRGAMPVRGNNVAHFSEDTTPTPAYSVSNDEVAANGISKAHAYVFIPSEITNADSHQLVGSATPSEGVKFGKAGFLPYAEDEEGKWYHTDVSSTTPGDKDVTVKYKGTNLPVIAGGSHRIHFKESPKMSVQEDQVTAGMDSEQGKTAEKDQGPVKTPKKPGSSATHDARDDDHHDVPRRQSQDDQKSLDAQPQNTTDPGQANSTDKNTKALREARKRAHAEINQMNGLSGPHQQAAHTKVDQAETIEAVQKAEADARQTATDDHLDLVLAKTKDEACATINELKFLAAEQKTSASTQVNTARNVAEAQKAVADAQALDNQDRRAAICDAIKSYGGDPAHLTVGQQKQLDERAQTITDPAAAGQVAKDLKELSDAQTAAHLMIDRLLNLTPDQRADMNARADQAETLEQEEETVKAAKLQDDQNRAGMNDVAAMDPGQNQHVKSAPEQHSAGGK